MTVFLLCFYQTTLSTFSTNLLTAVRDVKMTVTRLWNCHLRGHSIMTPSLDWNAIYTSELWCLDHPPMYVYRLPSKTRLVIILMKKFLLFLVEKSWTNSEFNPVKNLQQYIWRPMCQVFLHRALNNFSFRLARSNLEFSGL